MFPGAITHIIYQEVRENKKSESLLKCYNNGNRVLDLKIGFK